MLVDLGRNDLGRVATIGSVRVPDFMRVERYSHVMHLVSDVTAELAEGKDAFDAVASVFPAGTLSGAPKIRAMQIVSQTEGRPRGPYGGLVGWFGTDGGADTAIAIRTVRLDAGGRFTVQAGAGIVYDSDPAAEAAETIAKSEGVLRALDLAARGLTV
jgi:anthranilate synthase component 1